MVATDPDLQSKNKNPLAAIEDEKVQHEEKMARMEAEMGAVLETKVGERRGQIEEVTRREEEDVTRGRGMVDRAREEVRDKRGELERERALHVLDNGSRAQQIHRPRLVRLHPSPSFIVQAASALRPETKKPPLTGNAVKGRFSYVFKRRLSGA